jgi:hypothetical protein
MKFFRPHLALLAALILCLSVPAPAVAGTDATGSCTTAELSYSLADSPDEYVLGPEHCLLDTPWDSGVYVERELELVPAETSVRAAANVAWPL